MSGQQDHTTRLAMRWTRSFTRPLQAVFTPCNVSPAEEFESLLADADARISTIGAAEPEE